jgi:hypothetical protein
MAGEAVVCHRETRHGLTRENEVGGSLIARNIHAVDGVGIIEEEANYGAASQL